MISYELKKALADRYQRGIVKKAFRITDGFEPQNIGPQVASVFHDGQTLETTTTFMDIAGFSSKIVGWDAPSINKLLDAYYSVVIPAVYENGGEVEKLIGDGVVAFFGPPFTTLENGFAGALNAARTVAKRSAGSEWPVKVALRRGLGFFTYVGTPEYREPTVVGGILTELFRLEEVAAAAGVTVYGGTPEERAMDAWYNGLGSGGDSISQYTVSRSAESIALKGVSFNFAWHYVYKKHW